MQKIYLAALIAAAANAAAAQDNLDPDIADYLRQSQQSLAVLGEGQWQSTLSFSLALAGQDLGFASTSTTQVSTVANLTYGLARGIEIFAEVPINYVRHTEQFLGVSSETTANQFGVATIGTRFVIGYQTENHPEFVGSLSFGHPLDDQTGIEPNVRAGLAVYHQIDPFVLSGGIGVSRGIDSGSTQFDLSAGIDFAVSDRFILGADFNWISDGISFGDALSDGITLNMSANIVSKSGSSSLEPFVTIGLTDPAADAAFGVSWTRRW